LILWQGSLKARKYRVKRDIASESDLFTKYMDLPEEVRHVIGHKFAKDDDTLNLHGLFVKCTFKGQDCMNETLWHHTNTPDFGNCYSFNVAFNPFDKEQRMAKFTGAQNGQ